MVLLELCSDSVVVQLPLKGTNICTRWFLDYVDTADRHRVGGGGGENLEIILQVGYYLYAVVRLLASLKQIFQFTFVLSLLIVSHKHPNS